MADRAFRRTSTLICAFLALAVLGSSAFASAQSVAEKLAALCTPDEHTLCLNEGRFSVTAAFQLSPLGPVFQAFAIGLTDQAGYFWFFEPENVELVVKVLNGCGINGAYWVFASGLTNLEVGITVQDSRTGEQTYYPNERGTAFPPIQDINAFHTCP